ncbi:hypothetical protein J2W95_001614 [Flavobacterium granuli]|uniref:Sensor histidine kinase n=1 Tax=Flavobacterium granuli TaxID=280093 RepID=A0ABU1S1K7_9FLAO|nr:hypothetical protein [Flavobacterium granuli]
MAYRFYEIDVVFVKNRIIFTYFLFLILLLSVIVVFISLLRFEYNTYL